jgi:hypothetical protein
LEQAASLDTTQAVGVYWSQAQILFALKRPQYTEKALSLLISTLSSNASTTTYSSAQITAFLYNSRLALARLYCIYQHLTDARSIYLDALESKWKLDKKELVEIAKVRELFFFFTATSPCPTTFSMQDALTFLIIEYTPLVHIQFA